MPSDPSNKYSIDKITVLLARASMSVLTFLAIFILTYELVHPALRAHTISDVHELSEAIFYFANLGLLVLGGIGMRVAIQHAAHAKKHAETVEIQTKAQLDLRNAQVSALRSRSYAEIYDKSASSKVSRGMKVSGKVREYHADSDQSNGASLSQYATLKLKEWNETDDERAEVIFQLFETIEDVGLLVRRQYVDRTDVYYAFGGILDYIDEMWKNYIDLAWETFSVPGNRTRMFEHTRWLLDQMHDYVPPPDALLPWQEDQAPGVGVGRGVGRGADAVGEETGGLDGNGRGVG